MNRSVLAIGIIAIVASGCAMSHPPVDPSRSYPDLGTGNVRPIESASLIVRTPTRLSHEDDVARYVHTGYDIYDDKGKWQQYVTNRVSFTDEGPVAVTLSPGRYLVGLECGAPESRLFWVTVEPGAITEVDATTLPRK
ncbi:MAG: hypothetical protein L0Z55_07950 [Planctomycetes bacterium]|nr:hypothetical protein [Planctomycetota bacterium]